jgi:hypothetical protein
VQLERGARNIFRFRDGDKITEMAQFHFREHNQNYGACLDWCSRKEATASSTWSRTDAEKSAPKSPQT